MEKKLKKDQVLINGKTYTLGITAFDINGTFVPRAQVELNTFTNSIELKKSLRPYRDIFTGQLKYTSNLITYSHNGLIIVLCESILSLYKDEIIRDESSGVYRSKYDINSINTGKYSPDKKIYSLSHYDKALRPYTCTNTILNYIKYTFGFEIETSMGSIPEKTANNMGFAVLYDGSITGAEYVSAPMRAHNLQDLKVFLNYAKKVTRIDQYCSLHIHIGNIIKGERELVAMYQLFQRLTDELNQIIVPYKKDIRFLADKLNKNGRDHCKNLPKLLFKDAASIYKLLRLDKYITSDQNDTYANFRNYIETSSKWNMEGRYYNVNFLNYICKPINNTVEIRSLQSTYNFDYILTWLLVNLSIIDYAVNNIDIIIQNKVKIEIEDVLKEYIKDKVTLEITIENINRLKKLFYDSYYINQNALNNLSDTEKRISSVIIPYDHLYSIEMSNDKNIDNEESLHYRLCKLNALNS